LTAYRLHDFPESGNSYKLALMLTLCGQTFEPVWTDFGPPYDLLQGKRLVHYV
jgi:glutathione S-transferase